jgi:transcriptional regulator with XRE-family HTH domain
MRIHSALTDEAVLAEIGERLERTRLARNLTQRELAAEAGVERKAIQRLERGEQVQLTTLVRVLRAMSMLDALEHLVPTPAPSPIELLRMQGRERQRASGNSRRPTDDRSQGPWRWGDE